MVLYVFKRDTRPNLCDVTTLSAFSFLLQKSSLPISGPLFIGPLNTVTYYNDDIIMENVIFK